MFEWHDSLNTGIKTIDGQHQELFRIASKIQSLLKGFEYDKYEKIVGLINELKEYTIYHFKAEEDYMLKIKYKKFFAQKIEHNEFIETLNSITLDEIDINQDEYLKKMLKDVSDWIVNHIIEKDKDIASAG